MLETYIDYETMTWPLHLPQIASLPAWLPVTHPMQHSGSIVGHRSCKFMSMNNTTRHKWNFGRKGGIRDKGVQKWNTKIPGHKSGNQKSERITKGRFEKEHNPCRGRSCRGVVNTDQSGTSTLGPKETRRLRSLFQERTYVCLCLCHIHPRGHHPRLHFHLHHRHYHHSRALHAVHMPLSLMPHVPLIRYQKSLLLFEAGQYHKLEDTHSPEQRKAASSGAAENKRSATNDRTGIGLISSAAS